MKSNRSGSVVSLLLGGIAFGAVLGVLFAPKEGSETRSDINEFSKKVRKSNFSKKLINSIPWRVKGAAAYGALKSGAKEAVREIKEKTDLGWEG